MSDWGFINNAAPCGLKEHSCQRNTVENTSDQNGKNIAQNIGQLISDILGDKFKVRYALDNHGTPGLNSLEHFAKS